MVGLITGPIRTLTRALLLLFTVAVAEISGLYYYLRNHRSDAFERLLDGSSTGADVLEILLSVDVILVIIGLAVLGLVAEHLARTTTHRGTTGGYQQSKFRDVMIRCIQHSFSRAFC